MFGCSSSERLLCGVNAGRCLLASPQWPNFNWLLAFQWPRIAWIADWRIAGWSPRVGIFATSDPLEARFRGQIRNPHER
eukprot:7963940-Alexandrium_andersonii.AAC.1